MPLKPSQRSRAQESRAAIQRLYIAMRHLFIRGNYKPLGVSGEAIIEALTQLRPEIYGSINDPERVELDGLLYIFQRLPRGIEECRYIKLISREGFEDSHFEPIIPSKRRRNSYRIDQEQMYIEMTRGRSDIYDILTHLTFMYIEAEKIRRNSEDHKQRKRREWEMLEQIVDLEEKGEAYNKEIAYTYLSTLLGRTYEETVEACQRFGKASDVNSVFQITYWLGKLATEEAVDEKDREISFSSALREKIGHHYYGDLWARNIKSALLERNLLERPIHIISANLHSVMNTLYAPATLGTENEIEDLARSLSDPINEEMRQRVYKHAIRNGMIQIDDTSGTNISVQIIDTTKLDLTTLPPTLEKDEAYIQAEKPVILVMDYAFGEQAYETMDELLKPFEYREREKTPLEVRSISIMGKAGILEGGKGDIMIPDAHVFEGTADNYPIENKMSPEDFRDSGLGVSTGPMITVMGTSLQNRDILRYFLRSSWKAAGLEMEGAHYQKAIQAASKIRKSINENVSLCYAYYASDNPLISGQTLASGSLGADGVKPTYLITTKFLNRILCPAVSKPQPQDL
ncbi:MAG: hypothetical protein RIC19_05200 [Phaeodactylibacter sp.]|uniref:DUF6909 family protein n=1 Tax=Phaeodactylibacter sp. TaxID=1940289 RepID=UPI0032EE202D